MILVRSWRCPAIQACVQTYVYLSLFVYHRCLDCHYSSLALHSRSLSWIPFGGCDQTSIASITCFISPECMGSITAGRLSSHAVQKFSTVILPSFLLFSLFFGRYPAGLITKNLLNKMDRKHTASWAFFTNNQNHVQLKTARAKS